YGCTEQTMSRFLPTVITAKTLRDLGLHPEDIMGRVFGGIETNNAAATHPKGKKDLQELDAIVKAGVERLYDFQHADGGWAWWKSKSRSKPAFTIASNSCRSFFPLGCVAAALFVSMPPKTRP